ncbi:MAG: LytR C-terminal domain-containing protein [Acidimicrobiales bacterium]
MSPPGRSDDGSFTRDAGTQTVKAVVLIVVAVLVALLLLHHSSGTTTATTKPKTTPAPVLTAPATAPSTTVALIPTNQIKLLVLNGTQKGILAGQFTTKLKEMGYLTQTPDNTTKVVDSSTVYAVSAQYAPEAQFLAQQLGLEPTAVVTNVPSDAPIATSEQSTANVILVVAQDLQNKA